ncbi:MAG: GNAT family N-acetyltransferase [Verrucomicrobiae bacterium]|nr:GNAT family N-acetyltransferase [Verrucomicrobiae bacterium]
MKPPQSPSSLPAGEILRFSAGSSPDARSRLDVERLAGAALRPLHDGDRMPAWLQDLPWESERLGAPCFNLWVSSDPEDARTIARLAPLLPRDAFIWVRVASEHLRAREALAAAGFAPVLEMLNFARRLSQPPPAETIDAELVPALPSDIEVLAGMGARLFTTDRFHADRRIPRGAADALHADWAANCARGTAADVTLLATRGGTPAGFHAWRILSFEGERAGATVLIGTLPEHSGRGIARALLQEGLARMFAGGARTAWVRTEAANHPACGLYASCGFAPCSRFWYFRMR